MTTVDIIVAGEGIESVTMEAGATVADLANRTGKAEYTFTLSGRVLSKSEWSTVTVDSFTEIWASRGAKGA